MASRRQSQDKRRRRFTCSHHGCTYSFAKCEHLARHERTHSGFKPYSCSVCHRSFARNDSLLRHSRLHGQDRETRSGQAVTIKPIAQSHTTNGETSSAREPSPATGSVACGSATERAGSIYELSDAHNQDATRDDALPLGSVTTGDVSAGSDDFWANAFLQSNMLWDDMSACSRTESTAPGCPLTRDQSSLPAAVCNDDQMNRTSGTHGNNGSTCTRSTEVINQAVKYLNGVVHTLPSRLTIELETASDCNFGSSLNDYLDIFLARFPSVLKVIHKPTFEIGETAPSALLLMLALGSNFLGTSDAIAKGESLWTLAHAVATTSWSTLLTNRGTWDLCDGVQLVLTAAIGQTYALMSGSNKLRTTAQVVHDLGFHWARRCGMYDVKYVTSTTDQDSALPVISRWRAWAASETQLRALLAHYILDGHLTQLSGESVCVRHSINPLPMPASDAVFEASDPHTWEAEMTAHEPDRVTFREYILALFQGDHDPAITRPLSEMSIFIVLECFQSFASERQDAGGDAVGLPSQRELVDAMTLFYRRQILMQGSQEQNDQAIRWHSILGFSICTNIRNLCHQLCQVAGTPHTSFPPRKQGVLAWEMDDIWQWVACQEGRTALLHSFAICDKIKELRLGHASGIHVPFAAFHAAMTILAFLFTGCPVITAPAKVDWAVSAHLCSNSNSYEDDHAQQSTNATRETASFVRGVSTAQGVARNLQVEVHGLRKLLRTLGETWGVSVSMEATLKSLQDAVMLSTFSVGGSTLINVVRTETTS